MSSRPKGRARGQAWGRARDANDIAANRPGPSGSNGMKSDHPVTKQVSTAQCQERPGATNGRVSTGERRYPESCNVQNGHSLRGTASSAVPVNPETGQVLKAWGQGRPDNGCTSAAVKETVQRVDGAGDRSYPSGAVSGLQGETRMSALESQLSRLNLGQKRPELKSDPQEQLLRLCCNCYKIEASPRHVIYQYAIIF